ncbi:MAG: PQQ-binding-like beta-propeller repeat protein [Planctomycetes bacterium]|nr:PQQ-binding-like beta-propeller repeat protein [Planctomycetota bacterium]
MADDVVSRVYLVGENIYAVTARSNLYAVHADVGTIRWAVNLGGPGNRVFQPTHVRSFWGRDLTLVSTSETIKWLDRATGEQVATLDLDFIPSTSALSDGVRTYVCGLDSMLHCIELVPSGGGVAAIEKWRIRTQAITVSSPVLWGGGLFFASQDAKIRACDSYDKSRFWVFKGSAPITADIYVDSTGVYFGSSDHNLYKLDVNTGRGLWRFRTPGMIRSQPVLLGEMLYQQVEEHGMYAVHTDTGEQVWHAPDAAEFISASDDQIYMLSRYGEIVGANQLTGRVQSRMDAGNVELVARNTASAAMYLGSRGGRLMCAQHKSIPYLRFEDVQARQANQGRVAAQTGTPAEDTVAEQRPRLIDLLRSKSDATPVSNEN